MSAFHRLGANLRALGQAVGRPFRRRGAASTTPSPTEPDLLEGEVSLTELWEGIATHLEDLRRHLFRAVIALVFTTGLSLIFADKLMIVLAAPLGQTTGWEMFSLPQRAPAEIWPFFEQLGQAGLNRLQVIEPTESVGVFMRVALLAGLAFAMPWIVLEIYLFIQPALHPHENRLVLMLIPAVSALFLLGITFTYFLLLPPAVQFLYGFMNFQAAWRPSAYFNLITSLMLWIGLAFQMPLVVYGLAAFGLVNARQLIAQWRIAIIAIAVLAAVITPTVDPVNMGLVMAPMILLYGCSIIGAAIAGRQRAARLQREAQTP